MCSFRMIVTTACCVFMVGCEKRQIEPCPQAGRDFLERSVRAYFDRFKPNQGGNFVQIFHDEEYNPSTKGWIVSVDSPDREYFALVSCAGSVELSVRELGGVAPKKSL